jgi:hypothetical protein
VPRLAAIGEGEASGTPGIIGDGVHFLSPAGQRRSQRGVVMGRRIGLLVSLVALVALGGGLLGAAPAWATPPKQFHQVPFNFTIPDDALSAACGFDVFDVLAGNVDTTLFYDQSGTLIREIDTGPSLTLSFAAPSTGKSIGSRSPAVLITDYTGGGALGTAAVASLTGLQIRLAPGVMFTGNQVFDAVVVDHSPEGVPIIEFTNMISQSGNFFSGDFAGVVCAALSGP